MEKWPNFFIVGAARCGTTSLYNYLNESSDVFMSKIKEPHFFSSNFCELIKIKNVKTREDYLKLFENVAEEKAVGEASPHYFQAIEAPKSISKILPNSKIIIMLRDPVERFFSHYLMLVKSGRTIQDFEEVLMKYLNENVSKDSNYYVLVDGSFYYDNVMRYTQYFKKEQIKIIFFEEFTKNADKSLQSIFEFLNINSSIPENINQIYNEFTSLTILPQNKILSSILRSYTFRNIVKHVLPRRTRNFIRETFFVKKDQNKPEMKDKERDLLVKFYQNDVEKIKKLLGRKLPWSNF